MMKRIFTALTILCSVNAFGETMVCKEYGYANSPEGFHSITLEKIENTFEITPTKVVYTHIGRTWTKVDPKEVDLADMDVLTYKLGLEVLYIYKEKGATKIGISTLVEDSDAFFGDKALYSDCSFVETEGGSQHAVASKSLPATEARGVSFTVPVYRF